ncbi:hypothetical protein CERZMDRAFT_94340 [Cercospora zeae-maydis SCOH1-5]|uniref:Uncharacterized protein n=1 Tax=Cercospora zeae-maydis SCOH1-5 TaxID=717836 RepID=A0A6A6FRP4_9PEZI|nr:hypothetical protein CERZMDRAFT_94340 [Cercospora zeae-maydis SCOH1-5]
MERPPKMSNEAPILSENEINTNTNRRRSHNLIGPLDIQILSEAVNKPDQEIEMIDETWNQCHGPKENIAVSKPTQVPVTEPLRPPHSRTHGEKRKLSATDLANK